MCLNTEYVYLGKICRYEQKQSQKHKFTSLLTIKLYKSQKKTVLPTLTIRYPL